MSQRAVLEGRRSGVLLHLSALGPGALGEPGRRFIDWCASAGFSIWQILPVGPTGGDGSPYWVGSDHAGNPAFLDRDAMPRSHAGEYEAFRARATHWLDDYALWCALREVHSQRPWPQWPEALREREPRAIEQARRAHRESIERIYREQYAFELQWRALRAHAHSRGVRLFGDLPIYVAPDAVDVWAHRSQFVTAPDGSLPFVAGVPPDYFSADGQRWGNPLYDWDRMREDGFAHWRRRIRGQLARFDLLRLDHFRGLAAHWAVPASAPTAREGSWVPSAGLELLDALQRELGHLPLVAEDLGVITPDVEALRARFALPGMRVLQFGFDGTGDNPHLPHMYERDSVVYTGTHDNDTTCGWLSSLDGETLRRVEHYVQAKGAEIATSMARVLLGSVARLAVLPVQDLLQLGSEARFNTPGTSDSRNWSWRLDPARLDTDLAQRWSLLNRSFGRLDGT